MGFGYCRKIKSGWLFVEGASDHQVLTYCEIVALGIPGAATFKAEMTPALLPFTDIAIVQEPEKGGEQFVGSIKVALNTAEYKGTVKAGPLSKKDPRALWLKLKEKEQLKAGIRASDRSHSVYRALSAGTAHQRFTE